MFLHEKSRFRKTGTRHIPSPPGNACPAVFSDELLYSGGNSSFRLSRFPDLRLKRSRAPSHPKDNGIPHGNCPLTVTGSSGILTRFPFTSPPSASSTQTVVSRYKYGKIIAHFRLACQVPQPGPEPRMYHSSRTSSGPARRYDGTGSAQTQTTASVSACRIQGLLFERAYAPEFMEICCPARCPFLWVPHRGCRRRCSRRRKSSSRRRSFCPLFCRGSCRGSPD